MRFSIGVVGAGLAGLTAAISLARRGADVTVFSVGDIKETNSYRIQAGITLPILQGDSLHLHVMDTLKVGSYINDIEAVWSIISKATEAYDFLKSCGIRFESVELEGGHSRARVFSIRGETGRHIMEALWEEANRLGVKLVNKTVSEVLIEDDECKGLIDYNGEEFYFDAVIIASGGYSGLYKYTAGSYKNVGVLIGDLIRKGCVVSDLEFIQFHPTAYISRNEKAILISEAVRGRGAVIVDSKGRRFINELAPRDVVARAIYRKLRSGEGVYLDARSISHIDRIFPSIYSSLLDEGYDMKKDLIPISPVAHYTIGGIKVDLFWRTCFKRLYAIGEVADVGFHGANRLPSNSSLECVVGGLEVARTIVRDLEVLGGLVVSRVEKTLRRGSNADIGDLEEVREVMWKYVGVERSEEGLLKALNYFEENKRIPSQIRALVTAVAMCALERRESRGVHYRIDFPEIDERFRARSTYRKGVCRIS